MDAAASLFRGDLLPEFRRAVRKVKEYSYSHGDQPAYFVRAGKTETEPTAEQLALEEANAAFSGLINGIVPTLAYAYNTPGPQDQPNPYYLNQGVFRLYSMALEYSYSRGLTEEAWLPDHAGTASAKALQAELVRTSGDFSRLSLRLGGFVQSIFLMRNPLADANLLTKYRSVARNLVVNNGVMYPAFHQVARKEAGINYPDPLPFAEEYHLNADGIRLFVDYFWPYFLLIEDTGERSRMAAILSQVVAKNVAIKPGVQGTIKPDGTAFHHGTAYVGAYGPFAIEAFAQLLYLVRDTTYYRSENVAAVKLALDAYRVMVQKYSVSAGLRGRFVQGDSVGTSNAISKAMLFLAHPDGMGDFDMKARFKEFFDEEHFFSEERRIRYHEGSRGIGIRGLGIYRLIDDMKDLSIAPAETPSGVWIKPYAAAGFFRRADWLVTAKGFSQYFWDYEGPLNARQNSFGQNWAYGLLQVFSAGVPISDSGSGYDLSNGWDWYHVPGTTASHYRIEERTDRGVRELRSNGGIVQRDTQRNYNTKTFVGGVSLGDNGFFVQDLESVPFTAPTDLQGRKSYFFVGDQVLALGSHISGGTAADETHTTIFQTRLESADSVTWVNGEEVTGLDISLQHPAGSSVKMVDSVGNSYYLVTSTAELFLSRELQQSMTEQYEATEGAFAQAYLNHGIKPEAGSYHYVLIPADGDAQKLNQLAANPAAYYQVLDSGPMHLVYFPAHSITAYAFYGLAETPADQLVQSVSQAAAVITQEEAGNVRLAVSVPDIGWQFEDKIVSRGLSYASSHFARQIAATHTLSVTLRGNWCIQGGSVGTIFLILGSKTVLQMQCKDGLSTEILLQPCGTS